MGYLLAFIFIVVMTILCLTFLVNTPPKENDTEIYDVIKVLQTEKSCVWRNDNGGCDRDCEHCDLVMDSQVILNAYDKAIEIIEKYSKIKESIDELRRKL